MPGISFSSTGTGITSIRPGETLPIRGLYLQSADTEKIDEIFARAAQKGAPMVCFQCADDTVYQEVYRLLIEEQGIFAYLPESETTAAYLDSDRERTFYFWFTEVS